MKIFVYHCCQAGFTERYQISNPESGLSIVFESILKVIQIVSKIITLCNCICTQISIATFYFCLVATECCRLGKRPTRKVIEERAEGLLLARTGESFVVGLALESCAEGFHFSRIHEKSIASL